ncbi:MAG: CDP-glycerol glycerophosphotransferase family protein [Methanoregulaceae archaeon]|jgi:hypothetical protein
MMKNVRKENSKKLTKKLIKYGYSFFYKHAGIYVELIYDLLVREIIKILRAIHHHAYIRDTHTPSKGKVLFISQDGQWGPTKNNPRGDVKKTDLFFDSILEDLKKDHYEMVGIYPIDLYPIRGLKIFRDKLRFADFRHVPLNSYWDMGAWNEEKRSLKVFVKNWSLLKESKKLDDLLSLEGDIFKELVMPELSIYFHILYPHLVKYIHIARKMIQSEKPDLILLLNEFFWWERSLVIAAKMENVPTIALQHGVIHPHFKNYTYSKDEIDSGGNFRSPYAPIPDKTLVYGPYYEFILTKISSYPAQSVVVTGQPRYDVLFKKEDKNNMILNLKKQFNLTDKSRIILWTTQCHELSESENRLNLHCVFNALKQLDNCVLFVKQHPNEGYKYRRLIKQYMKNYDFPIFLLQKKFSTNLLILCCDVMITKNSITGVEALIMEKPVIVLNLMGEPDSVDYVHEGVAKGVYQEGDLFAAIKEVLEKTSSDDEKRENYLNTHINGLKGDATQKTIAVIKQNLNRSRKIDSS